MTTARNHRRSSLSDQLFVNQPSWVDLLDLMEEWLCDSAVLSDIDLSVHINELFPGVSTTISVNDEKEGTPRGI